MNYDSKMKIAVIAADGRLGRAFVNEALAHGHQIRAGVRGTPPVSTDPNLVYVECDATDPAQVAILIQGQEVVVSAIGHVKGSAADVQTVATKVVVQAMNQQGIQRFVDLTGTGARVAGDKITLLDRFLNLGVGLIDPTRVRDGITHLAVLQASNLEWTTVRVLKLQNVPPSPFELLPNGPTKPYVGRQEAARAMVMVIEEHSFVRQAPIIGKKRG